MKLKDIKANPNNPRIIRDERFEKLKRSIQEFPKMMELRPIVLDSDNFVLGGNMRLRALQDLGFKEVPDEWVKQADKLTEEEKQRFIIADNVGFGDWDWQTVASNWDAEKVEEWGLDVPGFAIEPEADELIDEEKNKPPTMKITFPTPEDLQKCENEIQEVLNRLCPNAYYSVSAGEI
jgi:ParB-like chromosome segregation protein Spo0J